jgi:hypothetical protein
VIRLRLTYVVLAVVTIGVGLLVHLNGTAFASTSRDAIGDALWAAMMVWWLGALLPYARPAIRGVGAYAVCVGVEVSQLYHAPTLDMLRATAVGHLLLGSGFDPRDLVSYAGGVIGAVLLDMAVIARGLPRKEGPAAIGKA